MLKSQAWRADRHSKPKPRPKRPPNGSTGPTISLFRRYPRALPGTHRRNPTTRYKLLTVILIIAFYLLYTTLYRSHSSVRKIHEDVGRKVQAKSCCKGSDGKAGEVRGVMMQVWGKYREGAWGNDDVMAVSGSASSERGGWGAFIAEASTTLAVMELWDELRLCVEYLLELDFGETGVKRWKKARRMDPGEVAETYLGAMLSLVDMVDVGTIPKKVISDQDREKLVEQAVTLAKQLENAYKSPSGLPWPTLDLSHADKPQAGVVSTAHIARGALEAIALRRITNRGVYSSAVRPAFASLVKDAPRGGAIPNLLPQLWDVNTGKPVRPLSGWDTYYETLLTSEMLSPRELVDYEHLRWTAAIVQLRHRLASRNQYTDKALVQHLWLGSYDGSWYKNEMDVSHCGAAANILLSRYLGKEKWVPLGLALLEGCMRLWTATEGGLPPASIAWIPSQDWKYNVSFAPQSTRQKKELKDLGFWITDATFSVADAVGTAKSLFTAYRVTGEERYQKQAWDVFIALKTLWTKKGFAKVADVMGEIDWLESDSRGVVEVLMYLWLTFKDGERGSLDKWVFTNGGHLFLRGG